MKKLMKNKKGFTLMEMLIVVAIIVILVAISIPVFTGELNKANSATDLANIRAAKGVATVKYLTSETTIAKDTVMYYDAVDGVLEESDDDIAVYGKSSTEVNGAEGEPSGKIIKVTYGENGSVTLEWVTVTAE